MCQEHALSVWALIDDDLRKSGLTREILEERGREHERECQERVDEENRKYQQNPDRPGTIYYLQVGEYLKIGFTGSMHQRMAQYPPYAVLLAEEPGTPASERQLHQDFAAYRAHGREWYRDVPELRAHIADVLAKNFTPWKLGRSKKPDHVLRPKGGGMPVR